MLAGLVPTALTAAACVVRHLLRSHGEERLRTRLLLGALLLGIAGVLADLALLAVGGVPGLAAFGLMVAALLLAALVLRMRFVERHRPLTLVNIALVAALAVMAQLWVVRAGTNVALATVLTAVVVLGLVAALRPLLAGLAEERARRRHWATMGRLAEQMAHDLKNPLAAIHGAAQFLQREHAEGRPLAPHASFVDMIVERSERLARVIDDYQRIGRVEPRHERLDLGELVRDVVGGAARPENTKLTLDLAEPLAIWGDRDLLAYALENIVLNAYQAMPDGGTLVARTARLVRGTRTLAAVSLADEGGGMDVRTVERATEEFFTTTEGGTGLGLAYAARVAEAHGGRLLLESEPGRGTTVTLELGCDESHSDRRNG
jgi:signal transduction histidine kinase